MDKKKQTDPNHTPFGQLNKYHKRLCRLVHLGGDTYGIGILVTYPKEKGGVQIYHPGLRGGSIDIPESSLDFTPINFGIWIELY